MIQISRWKIGLVVIATVLAILFALPNVLPASARQSLPGFLPNKTLNLGLDLQGGSYLLMEVDIPALQRERLTNSVEDVRNALRNDRIGFTGLSQANGEISVRINDAAQVNAAIRTIEQLAEPIGPTNPSPNFTVARADDQRLRIVFAPQAAEAAAAQAVQQSIEIIRRRVDPDGTKEMSLSRQGATRIVLQVPGEDDPESLKRLIGQTAKLTFQMVDETVPMEEAVAGRVPPSSILLPQPDRPDEPFVLVKRRVLVSGESLSSANLSFDEQNRPAVAFRFNGEGARRFGDATTRNIGKRFAIILDDRIISAPVIQSAITGGSGQITGNFTTESATELANLLEGGALPAPLSVIEQRAVTAELGQDAIDKGQISIVVALVSVLVFMVLAYGFLFGGIAVVALLVNGVMIIAVMTANQAALTLPGIAGLILTLAVAVDANVLIYERMRDEVKAGRSPVMAMDAGFSKAMETILDANLTTLVAAAIMFFFGAGPVRGFAWTLSIGVFTSVFTAVLITQVLLAWWYSATRPKSLPIGG